MDVVKGQGHIVVGPASKWPASFLFYIIQINNFSETAI